MRRPIVLGVLRDALSSRIILQKELVQTSTLTRYVREDTETYIVATHLLVLVHLTVKLVNPGPVAVRVATESDIEVLQELVTAGQQRLGLVSFGIERWHTVEDNDTVCEVGCHDEIVFDNKGGLL